MHRLINKLCVFVLIASLLFASSPISVFAQATTPSGSGDARSVNQANAYNTGSKYGGGGGSGAATTAGTCVASTILNSVVRSAISGLLKNITGKITGKVKDGVTSGITAANSVTVNAPIVESRQQTTNDNIDKTNGKLDLHNNATVGDADETTGIFKSISWDSMAYCIVNTLIDYVATATVKWANSGFNGSPAYISNTENFFENIADTEAGNFLNALAGTVVGGKIDLCSKLNISVVDNVRKYYNSTSRSINSSSCTLTKISGNMDKFMNGNFNEGGWEGWFSMTQNPANNRIGATIAATNGLFSRINAKNNTVKLDLSLNNGFLSYKKCDDGNPKSCKTVTPGSVIQSSLEKSLNLPKDRLVLAQKFDQVIQSVVDNLIKVALNEVLNNK